MLKKIQIKKFVEEHAADLFIMEEIANEAVREFNRILRVEA